MPFLYLFTLNIIVVVFCGMIMFLSFIFQPVVKVFHALLTANIRSTFHKLNVHAGEEICFSKLRLLSDVYTLYVLNFSCCNSNEA